MLESTNPAKEAKKALKRLYDYLYNQTGEKPTIESFYPVKLNLLTKLLDWELDKVQVAGYSESGETVDAKSDFDIKKILLTDQTDIPKGRINFSHAHEIGHILLHGEMGLHHINRTRPFRIRGKNIKSPSINNRYEVEADRFAAELLMPKKAVSYYFHHLFEITEIVIDSPLATEIEKKVNIKSTFNYESDLKLFAKKVAGYSQQNYVGSLADIFFVTNDAMANRLIELGHVLP